MRSAFVFASLSLAIATPFTVPANDSRWDIMGLPLSPPAARLERLHGIGCLPGADGLVVNRGVRVEFLFQGTQLRIFGIPPPRDTQILMDDAPLAGNEYLGGQAACVPFAEWPELAPQGRHNLTILTPGSNVPGLDELAFLIANATGTLPDDAPSPSPSSSTQSTLPTASASTPSHDSSPSSPPQPQSSSGLRPALLIAAVLAPLSAFFLVGFAVYFLYARRRRASSGSQASQSRSASFKGMKETQFVIVTAGARPDTPGSALGVVKV